ncbi:glycerophosphodiester phosphodiesterase [Salinicola rhizosphaerae]|uniref:Glycerophosphoryl diester phosphodiesterase n=1 Tax=Salinicola rhizosphaerae TaxID=1443141 RepID=A0ABQ3DRZ1_9GAMM|nr:glycerophosphodiester phosphodiesterase [Salinicola rhizosphaerae]GHB10503.1 glycerophosphoryl diester phosphodiesterase [Salinicola rhizosphaerae]
MLAPRSLIQEISRQIRAHFRSLVAFHLFFTLLATAIWVPLSAGTLAGLIRRIGRPVLSNGQILDVAFSAWGLLWLLVAIGLSFLVIFLQQAGMMLVVSSPAGNRYRIAINALWHLARRFVSLATLTFLQVGAHLLLIAPFAVGLAHLYDAMLGDTEPYILLRLMPPELWEYLAIAVPVLAVLVALSAALYFRWFLALPGVVLDGLSPLAALRQSRRLTHGQRLRMAALVLGTALLVTAIPVGFTLAFNTLGGPLLGHLPERNSVLIPAMLAYLAIYIVATIALTFLGISANSLMVTSLYHRATGRAPSFQPPAAPHRSGVIAWGAEIVVLVFALGQAGWILHGFEINDQVSITAHRGSSHKAPENTLASMNQAIADGADYLELDVRLTGDGQVVVSHDNNLRRLTGVDSRIDRMTLAEVEQVDVGSYFGDAFVGERIPTLRQVLDNARGKIDLYVELKPEPGDAQTLARKVIALIKARQMDDHAVIASLSPPVIDDVKAIDEVIPATLFVQFVLPGALRTTPADIIGLRHTQATPGLLRAIHRSGRRVAVWTVNNTGDMSRYIDMGVDNIITDRPDALAEIIAERREMSDGELLLVKLRNWLRS